MKLKMKEIRRKYQYAADELPDIIITITNDKPNRIKECCYHKEGYNEPFNFSIYIDFPKMSKKFII